MLTTPQTLNDQLQGDAAPLLLDVRPAEAFAAGHLPGAIHLDLWGVSLIDTSEAPLRAFMWMVGHLFDIRGVSPDRPVVVYEDKSGIRAARVFWFLEYFRHPSVSVLDGGVPAWTSAGLSLTTEVTSPVASGWKCEGDADLLATWSQVRDRLGNAETAIVDTRSEGEYYGEVVRAKRGGAIPGAVHLEWTQNLNADGTYKSVEDLTAMYSALGVTSDREAVTYCQGGYRAAHTYMALRLMGFSRVRNYTGSWKEWGDREDLPLERPRR